MQAQDSVNSLNSLLRGELSAVETYRQAIDKVTDLQARTQLQDAERSHALRVSKLRTRITQLGGQPADSSGPWGAFAKLVEGGAKLFGDKAAVAALEQGEDHGLKDYREESAKLDPESRRIIEQELMPEAERTHVTARTLRDRLN
jgi:uncharacterized protein (TIGR02284 family)